MKIYEFSRILGILMDNAIEASFECSEKIINIEIRNDLRRNRQLLIIENTYAQKDINIDNIFKKGYSSKPNNTGIGLWEVQQILKKNKNLNLYTTYDSHFFKQQLELYYDI
jgi:two-component system sensor histidine kinase AgrC